MNIIDNKQLLLNSIPTLKEFNLLPVMQTKFCTACIGTVLILYFAERTKWNVSSCHLVKKWQQRTSSPKLMEHPHSVP